MLGWTIGEFIFVLVSYLVWVVTVKLVVRSTKRKNIEGIMRKLRELGKTAYEIQAIEKDLETKGFFAIAKIFSEIERTGKYIG